MNIKNVGGLARRRDICKYRESINLRDIIINRQ